MPELSDALWWGKRKEPRLLHNLLGACGFSEPEWNLYKKPRPTGNICSLWITQVLGSKGEVRTQIFSVSGKGLCFLLSTDGRDQRLGSIGVCRALPGLWDNVGFQTWPTPTPYSSLILMVSLIFPEPHLQNELLLYTGNQRVVRPVPGTETACKTLPLIAVTALVLGQYPLCHSMNGLRYNRWYWTPFYIPSTNGEGARVQQMALGFKYLRMHHSTNSISCMVSGLRKTKTFKSGD